MNKNTDLINEQLQLFLNFINNAPTPIGIIEYSQIDNSDYYKIKHASQSFFELPNIQKSENQNAIEIFKAIKGVTTELFNDIINSNNNESNVIIYQSNGNFHKLILTKIDTLHISFTIEEITQLQQQKIELAEKRRQLKEPTLK